MQILCLMPVCVASEELSGTIFKIFLIKEVGLVQLWNHGYRGFGLWVLTTVPEILSFGQNLSAVKRCC